MKAKNFLFLGFIFLASFLALLFILSDFLSIPYFPKKSFKLGLDLAGGVELVYQADLSQIEQKDEKKVMEGLRDIMERRVNFFGVKEPLVQVQKNRLIIQLAGVIDPQKAVEEIGKTPFLEFREETTEGEKIIFKPTPLTGRYLKRADVTFDEFSKPQVSLEFDSEGAKIFEQLTEKNVGKRLAIFIDQNLISAPVVREKISGGKAVITGNFTLEEAKKLAENLNAGALPVPINLISQKSVGPTLGKDSLEKSLKAGVFGFLAIVIFMIFYYRLAGFFASLSLLIYILFTLSLFKLIPITLTLAGIAGFILSIGMAIDANILIFSRMREELKSQKEFSLALKDGFNRAWPAIRDGNLTTILVAAILLFLGTSFVRGFSITLSLGILVSMFCAIIVTRNFLEIFVGTRLEKIRWLW